MIKLIEIGDNGGRLETLDWSSPFSKSFVPKYSDFVLIDDTHKTNIHYLSLVVITIIDSLGKYIPIGFLLESSEHLDSITKYINLLKLTRTNCIEPSLIKTRSIMTDEGSDLVKKCF